jgi:hypothetical protein
MGRDNSFVLVFHLKRDIKRTMTLSYRKATLKHLRIIKLRFYRLHATFRLSLHFLSLVNLFARELACINSTFTSVRSSKEW